MSGTIVWLLAGSVSVAALLWPAIWSGFPIPFADTAGYLGRPFEGTLQMGRSALYGVFIASGVALEFWPAIIAQAVLVVWLVALTLRAVGLDERPKRAGAILAAIVLGLSVFTSLPWYASQLMPDILVPASVLALHLIAWHRDALRPWEQILAGAVLAAAIASHMSILALAVVLAGALAAIRVLPKSFDLPRPGLKIPLLAIALGILLGPLSNLAVTKQFAFTPGGANFLFGRLLEDGIVARYLDDHCPDPTLKLCAFRKALPESADDWHWDDESPLIALGGQEGFAPEARRIVVESFYLYPAANLESAAIAAFNQLFMVATGDGLNPWEWYIRWAFERYAPQTLASFDHSREQQTPFDFTWLNLVHIPVAIAATLLLPAIVLFGRRRVTRAAAALALTVFLSLVANAAICGVLATPHDRYQSRIVPLAPLAVALAALCGRTGLRRREKSHG